MLRRRSVLGVVSPSREALVESAHAGRLRLLMLWRGTRSQQWFPAQVYDPAPTVAPDQAGSVEMSTICTGSFRRARVWSGSDTSVVSSRRRAGTRASLPNAPVLLRAILTYWREDLADANHSTGDQPNDYHALVCSNYR